MKKIFASLFLSSLFCLNIFASSSVWKVSKNSSYIYIGGTVHVLSKNDYPLPSAFLKAYNDSQILVFETNGKKMQEPQTQAYFMSKSVYSKNDSLKNYLSSDTYKALEKYCQEKLIPINAILQFKPGVAATFLTMGILKELGILEEGVDAYFENMALKNRKKLQYLESVNEQIEFISNMGIGNEDKLFKYTLSEIHKLPKQMPKLLAAWKSGDLKTLKKMAIDEMQEKFPKMYEQLLLKRNNKWMFKIRNMFKTKEVEYVLVGAAHLVGEDGILRKLQNEGFKIQKLK